MTITISGKAVKSWLAAVLVVGMIGGAMYAEAQVAAPLNGGPVVAASGSFTTLSASTSVTTPLVTSAANATLNAASGSAVRLQVNSSNLVSCTNVTCTHSGVTMLGNDLRFSADNGLDIGTAAAAARLIYLYRADFSGYATLSLPTCDGTTNVGVITYDTTLNKHVGCDGTLWNALY